MVDNVEVVEIDTTSRGSESSGHRNSESNGVTLSATDSALQETDRSSDSSFVNTKDDTSSQRGETSDDQGNDENEDNNGSIRRCTRKWILDHFKKEWKMYYRTFELNEKLYFHYKGFDKIENMDLFPQLKCLYWEGNGVSKISGLETNTELMALYLQENVIKRIEGLSTLSRLHTLQLADNFITRIEGLKECTSLDSLYLKNNKIGMEGISDVEELLECPSIACLDIQGNKISNPEILDDILVKMPNLKVLYLQNNGVSKGSGAIKNYRKTIVAKISNLKYLDDRPVFPEDRRHAEAFARGGIEEERAERARIKKEEQDKHFEYHRKFKEMMRAAREEKRAADEKKAREEAEAKGEEYVPPKPVEEAKEEPQVYEVKEEDPVNDQPPELEQVDIEAEREKKIAE